MAKITIDITFDTREPADIETVRAVLQLLSSSAIQVPSTDSGNGLPGTTTPPPPPGSEQVYTTLETPGATPLPSTPTPGATPSPSTPPPGATPPLPTPTPGTADPIPGAPRPNSGELILYFDSFTPTTVS